MKHTDGNMRIARWGPANLKSDVAIAGPPGSRKPNRGGVKAVSVTIAEFLSSLALSIAPPDRDRLSSPMKPLKSADGVLTAAEFREYVDK